jgi:hypothetical protein
MRMSRLAQPTNVASCTRESPKDAPLVAEHDQIEARAFAAIACATPQAASALLAYAEAEAAALLSAHLGVVTALVDAIIERGVLTGDEVDQVIIRAMAAETLAVERQRRRDWQERRASAAALVAAVQP